MRVPPCFVGLALAFALCVRQGAAEQPSPTGEPPKSDWNVRVEVLMVAMPQAKALALLPKLKDEQKVEAAVGEVLGMIEKKEASLMGWPSVCTLSGQRTQAETIEEKRYPTEFDPPKANSINGPPLPAPEAEEPTPDPSLKVDGIVVGVPTSFETRNCGVTLEAEPQVIGDGNLIRVNLVPQRVVLLGFDEYDVVKTGDGKYAKIGQPQFATSKIQSELIVRNGQHSLIAVHKMVQADDQIEFFILRATAVQMK